MYRARHLPVHKGPAAWAEILGESTTYPTLESNRTADIVIIGAGFAGLSAARRALQIDPGLDLVLIDAGRIAEGAAGRNSGFMIDIPHELTSEDYAGSGDDTAMMRFNRKALAFGAAAVKEYGIAPDFFDPSGKINGAASEAGDRHNASLAKHLTALGEPFEVYDAAQMTEITGSQYYTSGLYTPGTVTLQPAGYVRGLAAGLAASGVSIYEITPALEFQKAGAGWQVTTPQGKIAAGRIILSVNGHLESFGFAQRRLMQLFLFAVMTPELTNAQLGQIGGQSRWGITPSDPMGTTVRRIDTAQGGNRIVTRTCAALRPDMTATDGDMARAATVMQRKFDARFPALAGMAMQYTWAGHLCLSLNGVSVAQEVETGVFAACVQNGLGTARGTLTGIAAAERALGRTSDIADHFAMQDPPKHLPPRPFLDVGANAALRWKEWRARAE